MPRNPRRRKSVRRTRVSTQTEVRVSGFGSAGSMQALGRRVREAAEIIAEAVKLDAAAYPSKQIPKSVHVGQGSDNSAVVYANSPNAYPIETGARHPTFGHRDWPWHTMKQRRFMENGAVVAGDLAAEALAKVCDDWAREKGFR